MSLIDVVKEKLQGLRVEESEETAQRCGKVESFLGKPFGGSGMSWGLVLLFLFAVYAIVNLILIVFDFF